MAEQRLTIPKSDELQHHGIMGMKWGIRRYQPYDGSTKRGIFKGETPKKRSPVDTKDLTQREANKKRRDSISTVKGKKVDRTKDNTPKGRLAANDDKIKKIKETTKPNAKQQKRIAKIKNETRIIKEIQTYEKKKGKPGFTQKFLDTYDDLEMWDLYSPAELFETVKHNGMSITDPDTLQHHGIMGMKWGIRRYQPYPDGKTGKYVGTKGSTNKATNRAAYKAKDLSDDELRKRINRINMERQYDKLTSKETGAGSKLVNDIVGNAAKETAKKYVSKGIESGVSTTVKAGINKIKK